MIRKNVAGEYDGNGSVVFISPDTPKRFSGQYDKELLILQNRGMDCPLETEDVPFFFTLDNDMKIRNLHIVNKGNFERTDRFLSDFYSR